MKTNYLLLLLLCAAILVVNSAKTKPKPKVAKQVSTTTAGTPAAQPSTPAPTPDAPQDDQKPPTIDWGKCPQLEPKEADKAAKGAVLEACLRAHPIPTNLTEEVIESHQKQIAECALKKEKWFSKSGNYRFSKAETEIKAKKLSKDIENEMLKHHKKCESEAKDQFKDKKQVIEQIQLYQACMDFHITSTCGINIKQ